MKKILCVMFALLMCVAVFFTGCSDDKPTGGVVDQSEDENIQNTVNVKSDIKIEEGETTVEEDLGAGVELFLAGHYYLDGTIYSDGEAMPVLLATDGTNLQFTANFTGLSFGVLVLEDATYAVLPATKQYTELSEMLLAALDIEDSIDVNEFQAIKDEAGEENASITQYSVTINGDAGLCTVYTYEDTVIKLYSIGDKLIQVENFDSNGTMTMQIVVNELSSQIPADQLTLKGLEEASVTSFIQAFMGSALQ